MYEAGATRSRSVGQTPPFRSTKKSFESGRAGEGLRIVCNVPLPSASLPPSSALISTTVAFGGGFAEERVAMCPSTTQEWRTQSMPIFVASRLRKILLGLVRTLSISGLIPQRRSGSAPHSGHASVRNLSTNSPNFTKKFRCLVTSERERERERG